MMDISVVIVSWNAKKYLLECLQSLASQQTSSNMEIIVVDNASTDGSPEAVSEQFPNVRLIKNNENLGFGKANNIGIKHSAGNYIYLINSDIKVLDGCLDRLLNYIEKSPTIGILGPKILNADLSLQSSCRQFPSLWNNFCYALGLSRVFSDSKIFSGEHMFYFQHDKIKKVDVLVGCFLMVRRSAFEQVGFLDEQFFIYAEDVDWCKRFWKADWEVVFFPDAQAIHYRGASSSNSPLQFSLEQEKSSLKYWKKHHSKPARITIFFIIILKHILRILSGSLLYLTKPSIRMKIAPQIEQHIRCLRSLFHKQSTNSINAASS